MEGEGVGGGGWVIICLIMSDNDGGEGGLKIVLELF